jgi:hypothetical protein
VDKNKFLETNLSTLILISTVKPVNLNPVISRALDMI